MLTTFVAACVDSSLAPMAQRAKKILQEEGSHRAHGEAWAQRLCRGDQRDAFVARLLRDLGARRPLDRARRRRRYAAALEAGEVRRHRPSSAS